MTRKRIIHSNRAIWRNLTFALLALLLVLGGCKKSGEATSTTSTEPAANAAPQTFATPEAAGEALYKASKSGDGSALLAVLGSGAKELIASGDPVQDKNGYAWFATEYEEMHRWRRLENGGKALIIGADNYDLPFPLEKDAAGRWYFNSEEAKKELVARRVGENELYAISVLYAMADAQAQYYAELRDGAKVKQFAVRFVSEEGKHNGLYWKVDEGQPESPLGPLAAQASSEGYSGKREPFHGYYFRILKEQGPHAKGGAKSYVVNGAMTGGFAFLAYPAEYRNSGVMSFLISEEGTVYQKDLGANTTEAAKAITAYDPDGSWEAVDTQAPQ